MSTYEGTMNVVAVDVSGFLPTVALRDNGGQSVSLRVSEEKAQELIKAMKDRKTVNVRIEL